MLASWVFFFQSTQRNAFSVRGFFQAIHRAVLGRSLLGHMMESCSCRRLAIAIDGTRWDSGRLDRTNSCSHKLKPVRRNVSHTIVEQVLGSWSKPEWSKRAPNKPEWSKRAPNKRESSKRVPKRLVPSKRVHSY